MSIQKDELKKRLVSAMEHWWRGFQNGHPQLQEMSNYFLMCVDQSYSAGQREVESNVGTQLIESQAYKKGVADERKRIEDILTEFIEDNNLGGFIAEIKTDDNEKLWVRIDNYLNKSISGIILLIDKERLKSDILEKIKSKHPV